ncbi:hypothetical protein [Sorangium sp. So ce861]
MIPAGVQVFVALAPVAMRCGFERRSGLSRELHEQLLSALAQEP